MACCGKTAGRFIPLFLGVATFLAAMVVLLNVHRSRLRERPMVLEIPPAGAQRDANAGRPTPARLSDDQGAWVQTFANEYPANVYASDAEAVRGLAGQLPRLLQQLGEPSDAKLQFAAESDVPPALLREMSAADRSGATHVVDGGQADAVTARLQMLTSSDRKVSWSHEPLTAGRMTLVLEKGSKRATAVAGFDEKPWLESSGIWKPEPAKRFIVVHSPEPMGSAAEATRSAAEQAARQLAKLLRGSDPAFPRAALHAPIEQLEGQLHRAITDGSLEADRFVQRFKVPYGEVYHAALLLDVSDRAMGQLSSQAARVQVMHDRGVRNTVASIAGVVLVVVALYLLLNTVTKGYFSWRLRGLALAAGAVTILMVLMLVR